jgi:hypothetical protein
MWHATMLETSVYYNVQRNSKPKICLKVNCYRTLYVSEYIIIYYVVQNIDPQ